MSRQTIARTMSLLAGATALVATGGCNVDSFMNPSVAGYWENYPTSMPILTRLDAIEYGEGEFTDATQVTSDDLRPNSLEYKLVPGDFVTIQVFELFAIGQWSTRTSRIDASGTLRAPQIGDVIAAGRTAEELEFQLVQAYQDFLSAPQVDIEIAQSSGFQYVVYGAIGGTGLYNIVDADLRLMEAIAAAGGIPNGIENIYVVRSADLDDSVRQDFDREPGAAEPGGVAEPTPGGQDVDNLIQDFDGLGDGRVSPGVLRQDGEPAIDVDDLETVRSRRGGPVDIDDAVGADAGWSWDPAVEDWVRSSGGDWGGEAPLIVDRVIEIPVKPLLEGDSRFNIVVRPDDRIYVQPPDQGVVYIEGEITRPGPYAIPTDGGVFTLSRLMSSAGGLGELAVPERVDITRIVSRDPLREATIRVDLRAIRNRTEPDIMLKPDDHINIGTNFWATPLAVVRNGFRASYGFGFILDRNFGNDVFGAPPSNVGRGGG